MTNTQQPEALNLEEFRAKVTHAAREPLLARIAELEAQLSAIGAGGVEPLHNREASAALAVPDERKSFDAANLRDYFGGPLSYRERDIAFMAWKARASLAATPAAAQGMDAETRRHAGEAGMTAKRLRAPKMRDGELRVYWGKPSRHDNPDLVLAWQGDPLMKRDTHLLYYHLSCQRPDPKAQPLYSKMLPSLIEELQARGYDITTLKFSIQKKVTG